MAVYALRGKRDAIIEDLEIFNQGNKKRAIIKDSPLFISCSIFLLFFIRVLLLAHNCRKVHILPQQVLLQSPQI